MPHNPSIVITESDFALLRRLAGHPRLAAELEKAVVIDSCRIASDIVTMHSRVRYVDQHAGEVREVTIVFPHEANDSTASISVLASVGTALLGLAVGNRSFGRFQTGHSTACAY
jgi:regulator of nucleoside diphosphate kinase